MRAKVIGVTGLPPNDYIRLVRAEESHMENPLDEYSKAFIEMQGKRKTRKETKERIEGMESEAKSIKNLEKAKGKKEWIELKQLPCE